jgi:hypothetical protein
VTGPAPTTLAVGIYDLVIANPGGASSRTLKLTVLEGLPTNLVVASATPGCFTPATTSGTITGSFLYPSSVVHVSGGAISDSILTTTCASSPVNGLGQCPNGQLSVTVDLSSTPLGNYTLTVKNPGPLTSSQIAIHLKASCP